MPPKKKNKGKRRKAKPPKEKRTGNGASVGLHEDQPSPTPSLMNNDKVGDIADSLDYVLSIEDRMSNMCGQIVSSLGDGYDAESLQLLDRKMCDYFLPELSFYYDTYESDDGHDDNTNKKSSNPEKPTNKEVEHYKKSDIIRKRFLRKAGGISAMANFLDGRGHENLEAYQEVYDDLMAYHYAWFGIIFKDDRKELLSACNTIVKFISVKLENNGGTTTISVVDEVHKIMRLLRNMKELFQSSVKSHDKEACDDAGILEYDCYDLFYKMAVEMAKVNRKDEAESYFDEASTMENIWGYWDEEENRHCGKLLEYAIGRRLSREDLSEIDIHAMENGGFYYKCLKAHLLRHGGSVSWKSPQATCMMTFLTVTRRKRKKKKNNAIIVEYHRYC